MAIEYTVIKRIIGEIPINIIVNKVYPNRKSILPFVQDPGIHIVRIYDQKAREVRESIEEREGTSNIKYYGDDALLVRGDVFSKVTNKGIRILDAMSEKKRYLEEKFLEHSNLIDIKVRENIKGICQSAAAIKYYYRMN